MKNIIGIILLFCAVIFANAQLTEITTITNPTLYGANYPGVQYDSGRFALNDPFPYNPNFPTTSSPTQGWYPDPTSHCFAADLTSSGKKLSWECDFTIEPGKELYALDLWGRVWGTTEAEGTELPQEFANRTQDLYLSLTNGVQTWEVPGGEWIGTPTPDQGAYARYVFKTAGVPVEILENGGHLVIEKNKTFNPLYFHIDELRLVAADKPTGVAEVTVTNPVLNGANYPGVKFDLGRYALNDDFTYDPLSPTADSPLQAWVDGNDTSHCFARGTSSEVSWECDFTIEPGKELYALDLWGRVWNAGPGGDLLAPVYAVRTQNLTLSLTSIDDSKTWEISEGSWLGASDPADGAYGRYIFRTEDIPTEIILNGGHLKIGRVFSGTDYFHIDELRLLSADILNKAPVSNAGEDQIVKGQGLVTLDGTGSTDSHGDSLRYSWESITDATIVLSDSTAIQPTFTAPDVTEQTHYTFALTVNDGEFDSQTDEVVIKVFPFDTNFVPIAVIEAAEVVDVGQNIVLDGTGSSDFEGDSLRFKWKSLTPGLVLSDTISDSLVFPAPNISFDKEFEFSLVVNDGTNDSDVKKVKILVDAENNVPVANAGVDQTVATGTLVKLDGTGSYDADGDKINYIWVSKDASITLSDSSSSNPTFTPSVAGVFEFTLDVYDNEDTSAVSSTVEITVNTPPVADPGLDRRVSAGDMVQLDGTGSTDADGDAITYLWTSKNPNILLSGPTNAQVSFTAPDVSGVVYRFGLIVDDGKLSSLESIVEITVNASPIAHAGINRIVYTGQTVELDGTGSYDPDGDTITYSWVSKTNPFIILSHETLAEASFTAPDTVGIFQFGLTVSDGMDTSFESVVDIIVEGDITDINGITGESIVIYPNPVKDILTIVYNDRIKELDIDIVNLTGKLVMSKTNINNKVDLSSLHSGLYFLKISYDNEFIVHKLIKE